MLARLGNLNQVKSGWSITLVSCLLDVPGSTVPDVADIQKITTVIYNCFAEA